MSERRYRPLIAIVAYHLGEDRVARWPEGGYGVPKLYLDAIRRAGARTAILSPGEEGTAEEILEPFDGLLLVGGGDIDPARYGGGSSEHLYGIEPDRDEFACCADKSQAAGAGWDPWRTRRISDSTRR